MNAEQRRLEEARRRRQPWRKWGSCLSERQWGTVREDYSEDGEAWEYFTHDMARSRAYRWGEDGLAGFSDHRQRICLGLALWNGREASVANRYSAAAQAQEQALCRPVPYRREYLDAIPREILDRDYGCGDPTPYVHEGETVLDLGSGGGKVCYILSQVVGPEGRVIGVDCNREMIALARRYREEVAGRIGFANVEFRYGLIQDLALDLEQLAEETRGLKIEAPQDWLDLRRVEQRLRHESPMIPDDSVDCVVSNCVLNLVRPEDRRQLFSAVFRVLKLGGRAAISDIVADEDVPEHLQDDPELWSGCISGAFREDHFLKAFEEAGFYGIEIVARQSEPWRTVEGIEFRSVTVIARKGKQGPCWERNQAVIYRGPFKRVEDDDDHVYYRGQRMAVCDKTFRLLGKEPYAGRFEIVEPLETVPLETATRFDCGRPKHRHPRETKGQEYDVTKEGQGACTDSGNCC